MAIIIDDDQKQSIRDQYLQGEGLSDIASELGVSRQVVYYHVQKMDLDSPQDDESNLVEQRVTELVESHPDIPLKKVSGTLDISVDRVKRILQSNGLYEKPKPFAEHVDRDQLIELYVVDDFSMAEIGVLFDVSASTVGQTLRKLDIPIRPRGTAHPCDLRSSWRKKAMEDLGIPCE